MNDCPPRLRGDLSKWLLEINTGVYVGQVSSRVRDALWDRVCQNLKNGRATMVYTTNGEQKMDFRVHNTGWIPVDYDGIKLMRRPLPQTMQPSENLKPGFSNAAKRQMALRAHASKTQSKKSFVVLDLETTGLQPAKDCIIEIAAIRAEANTAQETYSCLVQCDRPLSQKIQELTGITDEMLKKQGLALQEALQQLLSFLGQDRLVGYNIGFDMEFLRFACKKYNLPVPANSCTDLLSLARRKVYGVPNYKLATLAGHFSLPVQERHRAKSDCECMLQLYCKLNEIL